MYDVHLKLIGKRVVDFRLVLIKLFSLGGTAEALRAKIDWKKIVFKGTSQFGQNFQVQGVVPQLFFLSEKKWMHRSFIWCKNFGRRLFCFVTKHAFDRRTDRQTDRQIDVDSKTVRLRLQSHGKNYTTGKKSFRPKRRYFRISF